MAYVSDGLRASIPIEMLDAKGAEFDGEGFDWNYLPQHPGQPPPARGPRAPRQPIDAEDLQAMKDARLRGEIVHRSGLYNGWRFRAQKVPSALQLKEPRPRFPDFHGYVISEQTRILIEQLEPDRHQYFKVELLSPTGRRQGDVYILNVCNRLDAIDLELSTMVPYRPPWRQTDFVTFRSPRPRNHHDGRKAEKMVLKQSAISSHHLWRDCRYLSAEIFFSDEFVHAFKAAGLRGLNTKRVPESAA